MLILWNIFDFDPNIQISCLVGGVPAIPVGSLTLESDRITAQFEGTFSAGPTLVECTALDSNPANLAATFDFTVNVVDDTPPVIEFDWPPEIATESADPSQPLPIETETSPVIINYSVDVTEFGYPDTTAVCVKEPASGGEFEFGWGDTTITCTATDGAGNTAEKIVTVTVRYLYDIDVILPKGRAKAGSTIPIDIQYSDWDTLAPVDSSSMPPSISWASTDDCVTPNGDTTGGDDSGDSKWRYMMSDMIWQYSWQTKDEGLVPGDYLVIIDPPGVGVADAVECVSLR